MTSRYRLMTAHTEMLIICFNTFKLMKIYYVYTCKIVNLRLQFIKKLYLSVQNYTKNLSSWNINSFFFYSKCFFYIILRQNHLRTEYDKCN